MGDSSRTTILKLLIPDDHLRTGGDPAGNIMQGWVKGGDKPVRPIKDGDSIVIRVLAEVVDPANDDEFPRILGL